MKKAILILALLAFTFVTFAQAKKDTVKQDVKQTAVTAKKDTAAKPEFKADPKKVYNITLKLNAQAIYALTATPDQWAQVKSSAQLTGEQITGLERLATAIRQEIVNQQNAALQKDYQAFIADSTKPVKKK